MIYQNNETICILETINIMYKTKNIEITTWIVHNRIRFLHINDV